MIVASTSIAVGGVSRMITREQLAVMMYKFCDDQMIENLFTNDGLSLDEFSDSARVSSWAVEAMDWAVKNGYLSGDNKGLLNPRGNATRAQAAVIFYNLHYVRENGTLKPDDSYADSLTIKESDVPRIICWGDSLTEGWGVRRGLSYPDYLKELTDCEVINYGISSDTASEIALRLGSMPTYVLPATIPAEKTRVELFLIDSDLNDSEFGYNLRSENLSADDSINPVYINGVKGTLEMVGRRAGKKRYFFTRDEDGEKLTLTRMTRLVTHAMEDRRSKDVLVIWSGSNDFANPDNISDIIGIQRNMIEFADAGDRFISLGFTAERMISPISTINGIMNGEFGDRYLEVRDYLRQNGLADAGLTPTQADIDAINGNGIPPSLLCSDGLHGNPIMNQIVASLVAQKLTSLGLIGCESFDHIHSFVIDSIDEPGCITPGVEHYRCGVCGAAYDSDLNPVGHECGESVRIEDKYDSYTGEYIGNLKETCTVCGEWHIIVPDLLSHTVYTAECPTCGIHYFDYEWKRTNFCPDGICPNDGSEISSMDDFVTYAVRVYTEGEHSDGWLPPEDEPTP